MPLALSNYYTLYGCSTDWVNWPLIVESPSPWTHFEHDTTFGWLSDRRKVAECCRSATQKGTSELDGDKDTRPYSGFCPCAFHHGFSFLFGHADVHEVPNRSNGEEGDLIVQKSSIKDVAWISDLDDYLVRTAHDLHLVHSLAFPDLLGLIGRSIHESNPLEPISDEQPHLIVQHDRLGRARHQRLQSSREHPIRILVLHPCKELPPFGSRDVLERHLRPTEFERGSQNDRSRGRCWDGNVRAGGKDECEE